MEPIITVVTVTYNAEEYLEQTIQSVVKQNYKNLEYIIVDGGSTDGTIDIIKKFEKGISKWVSEKDNGIYDAMNKAVGLANGEYVNFMNAGDMFHRDDTVTRLFKKADPDAGLIYGDTIFYTEEGEEKLVKAKESDALWKAMIFNHNGLFAKRELLIKFPFDTFYKIVADSKFVIECFLDKQKFCRVDMTVNRYLSGGFSDEMSIMRTVERWKLVSDFKLKPQEEINRFYLERLMYEPFCQRRYEKKRFKGNSARSIPQIAQQIAEGNNKILVYAPIPVFPAIQGARIRIAMLCRALQEKGYELFLVTLGSDWIDTERHDPESVEAQYKNLFAKVIHIPKRKDHSKLMGLKANIHIDDAYEEEVGTTIKECMNANDIKIILFNYIFQSKALDLLPESTVKIIDTHDKFTDKYKIDNWYSYDAKSESIGISRADVVFAIQDNEKKYFESITDKKVMTIGHLTHKNFLEKSYTTLNSIGIISSGHDKDLAAVEKFVKLFIDQNPIDIKLKICGMVCDKLHDIYQHPSIEYLFLVDDLKDFYGAIDLCVIPPEGGTGLKIKSVEALSYGVPIVSTKHGFEGIASESKFHNATNIDKVYDLIEEIVQNEQALEMLKEQSRRCYNNYARIIGGNLEAIFGKNKYPGKLLNAVENLCAVSVLKNPIEKYRLYKQTMESYCHIKAKND